uniref:Uncharacterized protein n=1 Tax=Anopheles minimus TaxID=112268 RepID=A0A182W571_9DIPT
MRACGTRYEPLASFPILPTTTYTDRPLGLVFSAPPDGSDRVPFCRTAQRRNADSRTVCLENNV